MWRWCGVVGLLVSVSEARAQSCGDTLTASVTLTADVVCPPSFTGAALTIGAAGVTLSGNGFAIVAPGASTAVRIDGVADAAVVDLEAVGNGTGVGIQVRDAARATIDGVSLPGWGTAIASEGAAADLSITGSSLTGATFRAATLAGVDAGLVFSGNTLSGSREGLRIEDLSGPWSLPATNTFVGVGGTIDDDVISLYDVRDVSVSGLSLAGNPGSTLVHLHDALGVSVTGSALTGGARGVYTTGTTNLSLTLSGLDVSGSTSVGMHLDGVAPDLVLTDNTFDNSLSGLRIDDLSGPWSLPASQSFTGVAASGADSFALLLVRTRDVTVDGLDVSGAGRGYGVRLRDAVRTTVRGVDASRRDPGIGVNFGVSTDTRLIDNDVSLAGGSSPLNGGYGIKLDNLGGDLEMTGNVFDGSFQGIEIRDQVGPWSLDPTNSFVGVANGGTGIRFVARVVNSQHITFDGVDLSGTTGAGYAIRATNTHNFDVRNSNLSGRRRGYFADGGNTAATIRDNDVSNSSEWGIYAQQMDADLVLRGNVFDGSRNGLRLNQTDGPLVIDMGSSSAVDLGDVIFNSVVWAEQVSDVTFVGLETYNYYQMYGWSVRDATDVSIEDTLVCGMDRGVDVRGTSSVVVRDSLIGSGENGLYVRVSASSTVDVEADLLDVDDPLDWDGIGAVTTTYGVMDDTDGDGTADRCDPCPNDPLVAFGGVGPCVNVDLCTGDDLLGDADGDGWCADLDCDDADPSVHPTAPELCDGKDNDCLFGVDDGALFIDTDGDGCADCDNGPIDPLDDGSDFDLDGACDYGDPDDDDDGVDDADDSDPLDPWRCEDADADGCDDCSLVQPPDPLNDGPDADGDGLCNDREFPELTDTLLDTDDVLWSAGGVGAPSVVYDTVAGQFVMVYETQTNRSDGRRCRGGRWALGLATSPDGVTWTDSGGPLLAPVDGTYYACVAAHPSLVHHDGQTVLFFKAEQAHDCDPLNPPSWGCDPFTGVGRMALAWNGSTYAVAGPDSTPALQVGQNFGFPRAIYDETIGYYRLAYSAKPDVFVARGTASRLRPDPGPELSPPLGAWAPDELFIPAPTCLSGGGVSGGPGGGGEVSLLVGGRDVTPGGALVAQAMGEQRTVNWADWRPGAAPLFSTLAGDVEMKHWDVLGLSTGELLVYFDDKGGPGGTNRVRLVTDAASFTPGQVLEKVCQ